MGITSYLTDRLVCQYIDDDDYSDDDDMLLHILIIISHQREGCSSRLVLF